MIVPSLIRMGVRNIDAADIFTCHSFLSLRASHSFFWASTPTLSDGLEDGDGQAGRDIADMEQELLGPKLLSPEGLKRLVDAGELTDVEAAALASFLS